MTRRPAGVIVVSVILGLGTLLLLVLAFGSGVMSMAAPHFRLPSAGATPTPPPGLLMASMLFSTLLYLTLAGWCGTTLVGLVRMRSWARISAIVIGAALVFFGVVSALGIAAVRSALPTMPLPPNANPAALHAVFAFMIAWCLGMVAVGGWWLVYFALRSTRDAFRNTNATHAVQRAYPDYSYPPRSSGPITDFSVAHPIQPQASGTSAAEQQLVAEPVAGAWPHPLNGSLQTEQLVAEPIVDHGRRPVSMTVVAVLLLIGSFLCLLQMASPAPLFFMSVLLSGWPAHLTMLMMCAVSGVAGLGVLKLQKPAWTLAVGFFCVYIMNGVAVLLPGGRERFIDYMHSVMNQSSPMGMRAFGLDPGFLFIFAIVGAFVSIVFGGTMLFLLWRARPAFEPAPADQAEA